MANQEDIDRAELGKEVWNDWAEGELNKPEGEPANVDVNFSGGGLPKIDFSGFIFPGCANFANVTFNVEANFEGAKFKGDARFEGAIFHRRANFKGTTFEKDARFKGAGFNGEADFKGATFEGWASFNNATFEDTTTFTHATFKIAPWFRNAGIHQDTEFSSGKEFFKKQFTDTESEHSERAYRTLKLAMNKYQAHTEEAGFFKLELMARAKKEPWYRKWMYDAYGRFGDYGQSVSRPLFWWAVLGVAMFFLYFSISGEPGKAFTVAMGQALPLIGAEKSAYSDALKAISPPDGIASFFFQITRALHMLLSYALIFLSLLALRNRFKIK